MADKAERSPPIYGWWVTGLSDGEATFYAGLNFRPKRTKKGSLVDCVELDIRYAVALRADDAEVLLKLKEYFGCGRITYRDTAKYPSNRKRKQVNPQFLFQVRDPRELVASVVPHFERFPLQSKKVEDFEIWRAILVFATDELLGRKGWLRLFPDKVEHLREQCSKLSNVKKFDSGRAVLEEVSNG